MTTRILWLLLTALVLAGCEDADTTQGGEDGGAQATGTAAAATPPGDAPASTDGVTVIGHGRSAGQPDTARVRVGVQVVRPAAGQAVDAADEAAEEVLAAIRDQGIADEDVQTREYTVRPHREPGPEQQPTVTGYVVRNIVEVTVDDIDAIGQLLGAVTDAGGDDALVEGVHFVLEDDGPQMTAAREEAFEDARAKAEHYADLAGAELGDLRTVSEVGGPIGPPTPLSGAAAADAEAARAPISPGEIDIDVQVQATWALE